MRRCRSKETMVGHERYFVTAALTLCDLPVPWVDVQLKEPFHLSPAVNSFVHVMKQVRDAYDNGIQFLVINAEVEQNILLRSTYGRCCPFDIARLYNLLRKRLATLRRGEFPLSSTIFPMERSQPVLSQRCWGQFGVWKRLYAQSVRSTCPWNPRPLSKRPNGFAHIRQVAVRPSASPF